MQKFKLNLAKQNTWVYDPYNDDVIFRDYDGAFYDANGVLLDINEHYDGVPDVIELRTLTLNLVSGLFKSPLDKSNTLPNDPVYDGIIKYNNKGYAIYDYCVRNNSLEYIVLTPLDGGNDVRIEKSKIIYTVITIVDAVHINALKSSAPQISSSSTFSHLNGVSCMLSNPTQTQEVFNTSDFFRLVDRCVYDFRTGNLGVKKADSKGFSVFTPPATAKAKPSIKNCELREFGAGIPAVAMRTSIDKLKSGDMVIIKDNSGQENWLYYLSTDVEGDTTNIEICGIETDTGKKVTLNVQDGMLLDGNSVLCVKNFLGDKKSMKSMLPMILLMGQNQGQSQINPAMMMMLMGDGEMGEDMSSMLPLMLMGQGGSVDQNSLLMLMMMGKNDGNSDMKKMLPLLLLNQGGQPMNPMVLMMMMGMFDEKSQAKAEEK